MKMILQKHTSKFVAGLFNSLGITACVSLTSCGDKDKGKQTENQGEKLKNDLKNVEFYKNLADDEDSLKAIADWLNNKNYGSDYILEEKDLKEIFENNSSKIKDVAEKLGVILTESDPEPDDEKKKEIQKWVTKLNSLNVAAFNELGGDLKEKVAQKFIVNKIVITNDSVIKAKLAGFIKEVEDEKKESEISLKIVGAGKVTITKVANDATTDFTFDTFDVFEKFVGDLKGKKITNADGVLSFGFERGNVKICDHKTGFGVTGCFEKFLNCFEILTEFKKLKLQVSDLSLKIAGDKLTLNEIDCSNGDYFKEARFWILVRDYAAFFGITEDDEKKFEIVKDDSEGGAVVKIGEFKSSLIWSEVVKDDDSDFVDKSGWGNIFKLKSKKESKTEVTVKFDGGKYFIGADETGVDLNSLGALEKLVKDLNGKKVTIGDNKNFSLAFDNEKVKVCGHTTGFDVMKNPDFATLLKCVAALKGEGKAISSIFKIALTMNKAKVLFGGKEIDSTFVQTAAFWNAVKDNIGLFSISDEKIKVEKNSSEDQCKINESLVVTDLKFSVVCSNEESVVDEYDQIFSLSATKQK